MVNWLTILLIAMDVADFLKLVWENDQDKWQTDWQAKQELKWETDKNWKCTMINKSLFCYNSSLSFLYTFIEIYSN